MAKNPLTGIPIIGGWFDDSDEQAMDLYNQNRDLYNNIETPELQDYRPESYQYVGDYDPQMMRAQTVSEDPGLRTAQMSVLNKMAGLADTGLSDVDQAGYEKARQLGEQVSHSGTQAALQNAVARGVGGSGLEFALREQAGQDAAQRAQDAGLQQASDSARQRALYNTAYGNALSGMRSQDFQNNAANAGILNQFTMANTNAANQAQQYNLGNRQTISNANVGQRNSAQQYNNQMREQNFQNQMQRASGISGANDQAAKGYWAQNAANTSDRNANTALAFNAGMGMAGYGPYAKQKQEG